ALNTLAGTVDGAGGVACNSGNLILLGAKTYTGPTSMSGGGTLSISSPSSIASTSQINLNGSTLLFTAAIASDRPLVSSGGTTATVNTGSFSGSLGAVSGSGSLTKSGTGVLTVNSLRSGAVTVSGGTMKI